MPVTALMVITNYYQFVMLSIFTVVYFAYRYYQINKKVKGLIRSAFSLIGLYFVGVLLSGVVTIPNLVNILNNSRVGNIGYSVFIYEDLRIYFQILLGTVFNNSLLTNNLDDMRRTFVAFNNSFNGMECCFFSSIVIAYIIPQVFILKGNREDRVLLTLLTVMMIVPVFSTVFNGLSEPSFRWNQYIVFFELVVSQKYLDSYEIIDIRLLKFTSIVFVIVMIVVMPLTLYFTDGFYDGWIKTYLVSLLYIVLIIAGYFCIRNGIRWALVFTLIELCAVNCSYGAYMAKNAVSKEQYKQVSSSLGEKEQLENFLYDTFDDYGEFYRIYVGYSDIFGEYSYNENLVFGYKGTMGYDSQMAASAVEDIDLITDNNVAQAFNKRITDDSLLTIFNSKYALVIDESDVPYSSYELCGDFYGIPIYRNLNYINFGKNYDSLVTYGDYSKDKNSSRVLNDIICFEKDYADIEKLVNEADVKVMHVEELPNGLNANIESSDSTFFVCGVQFDNGWEVYINGEEVKIYRVNGGLIGFRIPRGKANIKINFTPSGLKEGIICTTMGVVFMMVIIYIIRKEN